jgi:hypothetical protein
VDDMQIRAWLGSPDDIGVNDDVALVRAPTRAKRS